MNIFLTKTPRAVILMIVMTIAMLAVVAVITEHDSHLKPEQEQMQ